MGVDANTTKYKFVLINILKLHSLIYCMFHVKSKWRCYQKYY